MANSVSQAGTLAVPVAPGPRNRPVVGILPEIRRKGMIQFYVDSWKQYGDIVRFGMGPKVTHLVTHPDYVKHVLVDNDKNYWKGMGWAKVRLVLGEGLIATEGAKWRSHRRIMGPPFTPRAVPNFVPPMVDALQAMLAKWESRPAGEPLDVNAEMTGLAMSIIARSTFSMDLGKDALEAASAFTYVLDFVSHRTMTFFDLPLSVPTPANRRFSAAVDVLDRFVYGLIATRRSQSEPPRDLLTTLLNATDPETGQPMSDRQVRDEMLTIFFAGHETTAQALTWAWFLLAQHPEVDARLREEVDRALGGRVLGPSDLESLGYPLMVAEEAMRLYPPIWVFVRDAYEADEIAGYEIPKGSMIMFSPYITHRHPDFWEEPDRFDPEHFSDARSAGRHKYAFFPFGGGPRVCLGNSFALQEAVLALSMVRQRARLQLVPGQDIQPRMLGTLRPSRPVMMSVEWR